MNVLPTPEPAGAPVELWRFQLVTACLLGIYLVTVRKINTLGRQAQIDRENASAIWMGHLYEDHRQAATTAAAEYAAVNDKETPDADQ